MDSLPYVEVHWRDTKADSGWYSRDEVLSKRPAKCISRGWLLFRGATKLILASSYCEDDEPGEEDTNYETIDPGSVTRILKLEDGAAWEDLND